MRDALARWWRDPEPWTVLVWLLPPAIALFALLPTGDLAYQIRAGLRMINDRTILTHDVFTYTMRGRPWLNQQWAAELAFGGLYRSIGWRGLIVLRAVLVGVAAVVTLRQTRARGADLFVAAAIVLLALEFAFLVPRTSALRPQFLALPLFLLTLWLLDSRADRPRRLLWLVPVGIVWANVHGSFVLLGALLAIAFTADIAAKRWRVAAWSGAMTLAAIVTPLISPLGVGTYRYIGDLLTSPVVRTLIDEWQPLWRQWAAPVYLVVAIAVVIVLLRKSTRGPTLEEAARLGFFTLLAIWSARNVLWLALAVPPILGAMLADWHPKRTISRSGTLVVAAAVAGFLAVGSVRVGTAQPVESLLDEVPDAGLTEAVRTASAGGGHVFAGWWWSWFELEIPDVPMFVDARSEFFPDAVWADWFTISLARPGWRDAVRRWGIEVIVTDKGIQDRLIPVLRSDPDWELIHEDDEGAVFVQRADP